MKSFITLLPFILASTVGASEPAPMINSLPPGVEPPPFMAPAAQVSPIEKVSPGIYRIGEITINKAEKSITFPTQVNMEKGLLEYLLVRRGGKTHESLLSTRVEPYDLQVALLLLGLEGTSHPISYQGAPEPPTGEAVSISFSYRENNGRIIRISPEMWIIKNIDKVQTHVEKQDFVYTGSFIKDGRFMAQSEGSIIALYHDPSALVDNASRDGESDKIWYVNEKNLPPPGTPVTLTIKAKR